MPPGGVNESVEQRWTQYAASLLAFSIFSFAVLVSAPAAAGLAAAESHGIRHRACAGGATPMTPDLAFNTAVSFITNTNWQNYSRRVDA